MGRLFVVCLAFLLGACTAASNVVKATSSAAAEATEPWVPDFDGAKPLTKEPFPFKSPEEAFSEIERIGDGLGSDEKKKLLRAEYVSRAMARSDRLCAEYTQNLNKFDRNSNIVLGGVTTLLAGLGAIFTPASTVRALSGSAAITSGWQGDVSEAAFLKQTADVLQAAMERGRASVRTDIDKKLKTEAWKDYPYSMAYRDVERYHAQCSLPAAFRELGKALVIAEKAEPSGQTSSTSVPATTAPAAQAAPAQQAPAASNQIR